LRAALPERLPFYMVPALWGVVAGRNRATPAGITPPQLEAILQALLDRHDLLRAWIDRTDGWTMSVSPPAALRDATLRTRFAAGL
jgi:hypothetical protein